MDPDVEADVLARVHELVGQIRQHELREHQFAEEVMGKVGGSHH